MIPGYLKVYKDYEEFFQVLLYVFYLTFSPGTIPLGLRIRSVQREPTPNGTSFTRFVFVSEGYSPLRVQSPWFVVK